MVVQSDVNNFDLLTALVDRGLVSIAEQILEILDVVDLKCCQLVCSSWNLIVESLFDHNEWQKIGRGWKQGVPNIFEIQCERRRAVCTVTAIAQDNLFLVCALGSSGRIELWSRRDAFQKESSSLWQALAHEDEVFDVDMNRYLVVSSGDEKDDPMYSIKIWNKSSGQLLSTLNTHQLTVWSVKLWMDSLFSFAHDCTFAKHDIEYNEQDNSIDLRSTNLVQGPLEWTNGLASDSKGHFLVTHNETSFELSIWNLEDNDFQPSAILKGHSEEVNCAKFLMPFLASGGDDKTVRIWKLEFHGDNLVGGSCIRILSGHEGKIWSLDLDRRRIVAGGRYGEIRIWNLAKSIDVAMSDEDCEGRSLWSFPRSTAVGQVCLERALLVASDGLGTIKFLDFWNLKKDKTVCGCGMNK